MLLRATTAYCEDAATSTTTTNTTSTTTEEIPTPPQKPKEEEESEDLSELNDEEWDKAKSNCGFCKFFLESPCAAEFRSWSRCVDSCRKGDTDFKEVCQEFTSASHAVCFVLIVMSRQSIDWGEIAQRLQSDCGAIAER
jgi:hypothetical protein